MCLILQNKKNALICTRSRIVLFSHRSIAFRASGVTTSERSLLMNTLVASKCCLGGESRFTLVTFDGWHLRRMCLQTILSMQKNTRFFFSIGPPIFRTNMNNFLNQKGAFVHCNFLGKVALAGKILFFILELKIRRNTTSTSVHKPHPREADGFCYGSPALVPWQRHRCKSHTYAAAWLFVVEQPVGQDLVVEVAPDVGWET